jgi:ribosomal protein S18 acetylase RimI-like enzyme
MLFETRDKERLRRHFERDKVLFAYHLGDLDLFHFPDCRWLVDSDSDFEHVILIYHGPTIPTVLLFGLSTGFLGFVNESLSVLPDEFYCHCQNHVRESLTRIFNEKPLGGHLKMHRAHSAASGGFMASDEAARSTMLRLDRSHLAQLEKLYDDAYPDNYFDPRMLDTNKYYGVFKDDSITAVSGIHVYSKEYDIAVLGNVATAVDCRGRGLATMATARLLQDLEDEPIGTICLNVAEDNPAAIHCYEKLGFEVKHKYREALFTRK